MRELTRTAKATLELELQTEALEGALTAPDGSRQRFSGWIELASAIEDWRQGEQSAVEPTEKAAGPEAGPRDSGLRRTR